MWAVKDCGGIVMEVAYYHSDAIRGFIGRTGQEWKRWRAYGYRIVRVRVTEVRGKRKGKK